MRASLTSRAIALFIGVALIACTDDSRQTEQPSPVVVVGIDGASWNAIHQLWDRGELPHLRDLAEEGVAANLKPVAAESPVIWTSMATGVVPERHGITNFVIPTANGDVPVTSEFRRVPAIWNMASTVGLRVAALGWWASWPAETINGVLVSDRVLRGLEDDMWPPEFAQTFEELVSVQQNATSGSVTPQIERQDLAMAAVARHLVDQDFDLLMVYLRSVDAESHPYWKYFRPQDFAQVDPDLLALHGDRVSAAYAAVDCVIGDLRAGADPRSQFFIISDHGFHAVKRGQYRLRLDFDRVLEHLGYLQYDDSGIDWSRTRAATWNSAPGMRIRLVKLGLSSRDPAGPVSPNDRDQLRDRLATDLAEVTYDTGAPAFRVREPRKAERLRGADLTVVIRQEQVSKGLEYRGEVLPVRVNLLHEITGTHDANTEGIFIAHGPDIDPESTVDLVHTLDVAPTLLYAMTLPIAQNFDGKPQVELFRGEFRRRYPVRTIPSWGTRQTGATSGSEADEALLDELRALGYLD